MAVMEGQIALNRARCRRRGFGNSAAHFRHKECSDWVFGGAATDHMDAERDKLLQPCGLRAGDGVKKLLGQIFAAMDAKVIERTAQTKMGICGNGRVEPVPGGISHGDAPAPAGHPDLIQFASNALVRIQSPPRWS